MSQTYMGGAGRVGTASKSGAFSMSKGPYQQNSVAGGMTRGSNRSMSNMGYGMGASSAQGLTAPLSYQNKRKVETEEEKVQRYERVIEKLKKMLDHERKNLKGARAQF